MVKKWRHARNLLGLGVMLFVLAGCGSTASDQYKINLEVWGVFDDSDAYTAIFNAYKQMNPHIGEITYRKLPVESYKQDLVDALASGNGPDIFMIRNAWTGDFADKMTPAPDGFIPEKNYRDALVDVAASDFIENGQVYAVPVSVDSLALYYNKDIFNAAGIARPPVTWEEVQQITPRLTNVDSFGNIKQSAIALGTAYNINRSTDIVTALMYQKGSSLLGNNLNGINFNDDASQSALTFYDQFADIRSPYYTWNPTLHYSLDAFSEGTLAMMVNYSWQYPALKQKNAKLNIGIAPLPQFEGADPQNQANYWAYGVSKNKSYTPDPNQKNTLSKDQYEKAREFESWQFLRYFAFAKDKSALTLQNALTGNTKDFTTTLDPADTYLKKTEKPAARRDLISEQQTDVVLAPFASGNLIAKNWFQGDVEAVEGILAEMINDISTGKTALSQALTTAGQRIQALRR